VRRLMRALISRGVFRQRGDGSYALNPLADTLRKEAPVSMAGAALFYGSPEHREHWSMLAESVKTGRASIPALRGKGLFDYLSENNRLAELFNGAMTSISEMAEQAIVSAYDFTRCREIADIGGGHGRLLAAILSAASSAGGVLYDLPNVVAGAPELLQKVGVSERVRIEEGSFFESVPAGADTYVLKNIIHDWPPAEAAAILRNLRVAVGAEARILLVELVIPEHDRDFVGKWADLETLLGADGRERTAEEYRRLLEQSGFRMTRVVPTAAPFSLVEAVPVE
jgi:C-methyltransferase